MSSSSITPALWSSALGNSADTVTIKDSSDTSTETLTWNDIFTKLTSTSITDGGLPPTREEFNALIKTLSDNIYYLQQGGVYEWSGDNQYQPGDIVRYSNTTYLCVKAPTVTSNTPNPSDATNYWSPLATDSGLDELTTRAEAALAAMEERLKTVEDTEVTLNTDQTITGKKTFTSGITYDSSANALGSDTVENILVGNFTNAGKHTGSIPLISRIGNDDADTIYNTTVTFGSGSGATVIGAGENTHGFAKYHATEVANNDGDLYFTADYATHFYNYLQPKNDGEEGTNTLDITYQNITAKVPTYAPTASNSSNDTQVATTNWVKKYALGMTNSEAIQADHNMIFRGENLLGTGHFASMDDLYAAIKSGNFTDIYVGDYIDRSFTYNSSTSTIRFRVAGINSYLHRGSTEQTNNHLVLLPDTALCNSYMNSTNTTAGGYQGSYMFTTLEPALVNALGGSSGTPFYGHILSQYYWLSNAVNTTVASSACPAWGSTSGATSGASWVSRTLTLLSECEVYGGKIWASSAQDVECWPVQLPLFRLRPQFTCGGYNTSGSFVRYWWWLRSVSSGTRFCYSGGYGEASGYTASNSGGVRPALLIG